jgi:dTDP-glucose pyrophosphorylase
MWAVVPVAGRATRLSSLTRCEPKALLEVEGRPILDRVLESLADTVSDACLIVDRLDSPIAQRFGRARWGIRLHYALQSSPLGVGEAVLRARDHVTGPFVVVMGDVYYSDSLGHYVEAWRSSGAEGAVLTERVGEEAPDPVGIVHPKGAFVRSIEKTHADPLALCICGMAVLPEAAFDSTVGQPEGSQEELELEEIISWLIRERGARFLILPYKGWRRNINTPADMASVRRWLATADP